MTEDVRNVVRERYAARAREITPGDPPSLGVGDPVALAGLKDGETVVDLGSGPGRDLLAAARAVGPSGRAIGVDMTPEMIHAARGAASAAGLGNVTVLEGDLERLPLPCASVDVVISNCVINLTPDKHRALVEAYRVLAPGGRLAIVDTAFDTEPDPSVRTDPDSWSCCVGGALVADEYVGLLEQIGYVDVHLRRLQASCGDACSNEVGSVAVSARKPGDPPISVPRPAVSAERPQIDALLDEVGLPTDLRTEDAIVLREEGALTGVVALERYGETAFLRSLAVQAGRRRRGAGLRLVGAALEVARWSGALEVYVSVPPAAQGYFERLGFRAVSRARARVACADAQLQPGCCADAAPMRLAFEEDDLPLLGRPSRKQLPTFQGGSCC